MRDRIRAAASGAAPAPADEALRLQPYRVRLILDAAATRIQAMTPHAPMTEACRFTEIQISTWDHHGVYNSVSVGQDITAALAAVQPLPLTGTRTQYAHAVRQLAHRATS